MTMDELLAMLRDKAKDIDVTGAPGLAVSFYIKDRDPGVFYVAVNMNGNNGIQIEPYEYNDRHCAITMKMDNFVKLINGKLDAVAAFTLGKLKVDGDISKALEFANLIKK